MIPFWSLLVVDGIFQGQLNGHELRLQVGSVVRCPLAHPSPSGDGSSTRPYTVRVDQAVYVVDSTVWLIDPCNGHEGVLPQLFCHAGGPAGRQLCGGELCHGRLPSGRGTEDGGREVRLWPIFCMVQAIGSQGGLQQPWVAAEDPLYHAGPLTQGRL